MKYSKEQQQNMLTLTEKLKSDLSSNVEEVYGNLIEVINFHDWNYYVNTKPLITDFDYDMLFKKLEALEAKHPNVISANSPTNRIAKGLTDDFPSIKHSVPMLSLDNSYNAEDLQSFDERVRKLAPLSEIKYVVEPKYDGAGISLLYVNDILVRGATRGNGTEGDDITPNAKAIQSIPLSANFSKYGIHTVEVRGEVVIHRDNFAQLNKWREEENRVLRERGNKELELFKHPRNTAAGGLRSKDPNDIKKRKAETFVYHIGYCVDADGNNLLGTKITSHYQAIQLLAEMGFKIPDILGHNFEAIEQVVEFVNKQEANRENYPYEMDGMVVKVDDLKLQEVVGYTAHHPRWAIAFKFKAKQAQGKLYRVDYQVGRTGAITPVGRLADLGFYNEHINQMESISTDKVQGLTLTGVEIKNVSLHNEDFIADKGIRLNDTVIVERSGDVIPYVVGPIEASRNGNEKIIDFPRNCPSCTTTLERPEGEAVWRCPNNLACPAQVEEGIIHYVSKTALDIDGLGKDIVKRFLEEGLITGIIDLYELDRAKVLALEGWQERSVDKLIGGVETSKKQPIWRLMVGLGIRHIGGTTAKLLADKVEHLTDFKNWTIEQLMEIEGLGPKVANSVFSFFKNEYNLQLIAQLESHGVNLIQEKAELASNKLEGLTFVFTGTLTQFSRDKAKALVEENGGKTLSSVSSKLNYLVAGEKAGSKLAKAEKAGVAVISESDFLEMIK